MFQPFETYQAKIFGLIPVKKKLVSLNKILLIMSLGLRVFSNYDFIRKNKLAVLSYLFIIFIYLYRQLKLAKTVHLEFSQFRYEHQFLLISPLR